MNRGRGDKADVGGGGRRGGEAGVAGNGPRVAVRGDDDLVGDDGDVGFGYDHVSPRRNSGFYTDPTRA